MLVRCESCEASYRLDNSRIPAEGTKVRCSRCKHVFMVRTESGNVLISDSDENSGTDLPARKGKETPVGEKTVVLPVEEPVSISDETSEISFEEFMDEEEPRSPSNGPEFQTAEPAISIESESAEGLNEEGMGKISEDCFFGKEKPSFSYNRRPAFLSFLPKYLLYFGIAFLLIIFSSEISHEIGRLIISRLNLEPSNLLWKLPYGLIFSIPFLVCGIYLILWNLMGRYEIGPSEIRLLTGSLTRKEGFFVISDFCDVSFKQNLLEAPIGIGEVILQTRDGGKLIIDGVHNVRPVVDTLRGVMHSSDVDKRQSSISSHAAAFGTSSVSSDRGEKIGGLWMVMVAMAFVIVAMSLVITSKMEILDVVFDRVSQFVARIFSG